MKDYVLMTVVLKAEKARKLKDLFNAAVQIYPVHKLKVIDRDRVKCIKLMLSDGQERIFAYDSADIHLTTQEELGIAREGDFYDKGNFFHE